jgi:6-phosphogluconolactonase
MVATEHAGTTPAALATHIASVLRKAIAERGQASLAVSGGKSPIALFEALRSQPLDWSKVTLILVDERVVPHDHTDSNTALVRRHLMQDAAAAARFVPFFDEPPPALSAVVLDALALQANQRLADLTWPLDGVVLGMGDDAHTASLFPGASGYARALESTAKLAWVVPTTAPHARLSLTLPSLLSAGELMLSIAGENKVATYRRAAEKADPALPISLLLNQSQAPVSVWMA